MESKIRYSQLLAAESTPDFISAKLGKAAKKRKSAA